MPLPETPHALTVQAIQDLLSTSPAGLTETEANVRLEDYGRNVLKEEQSSRLVIFLRQFKSILVYILIIAAIISLIVADIKDFLIIILIIAINSVIGFWQEVKAEASLAALKKLTESRVTVIRDGTESIIPSEDLVPGDCVVLAEGDLVTADIRLFETSALTVDESSLTGESLPVIKDHAAKVAADAPPYDLEEQPALRNNNRAGIREGLCYRDREEDLFCRHRSACAGTVSRQPVHKSDRPFFKTVYLLLIGDIFIGGNHRVPAGPAARGDSLSARCPDGLSGTGRASNCRDDHYGCRSDGTLEEKDPCPYLPAVETMGSATVIASDKTGTITERILDRPRYLCTRPRGARTGSSPLQRGPHGNAGDPIDVALSRWVTGYEDIRTRNPRRWVYPFDTAKRLMATANVVGSEERFYVKGAYEELKKHADNAHALRRS